MHGQRGKEFRSHRNQTYGIKINHLPHSIPISKLESSFGKYGTLAGIFLRSGETEKYAFINYLSQTDAQAAASDMDGKWFDGVQIRVKVQDQTAPLSHQGNICTVKVTNLSKHTTKNKLKDIFACCFHVLSVKVNQTNGNFNYAYVNFASPNDAEQAEKQLDGLKIDENIISMRLHSSGEATVGSSLPHGHFSPTSPVGVHPVSSPVPHGTSTHPPSRPVGVHPVSYPVLHRTSTLPPTSPVGVHPVSYPVPHGTSTLRSTSPVGVLPVSSPVPHGTSTLPPSRPVGVHPVNYPVSYPVPHGTSTLRSSSLVGVHPVSYPVLHRTSTLPPTSPVGVHPVRYPVPHGTFSTSPPFSPVNVHPVNYPVPHGTFSTPPPTRPVTAVSVPTVACHQSLSGFQRDYSSPASQSLLPAKLSSVSTAPFQPQSQKEVCMPQRPAPSRAFAPTGLQSKSVKVSIHGDLTSEDIEEIFSQFGKISEKPIVHPGTPNYAYVNFQSPKEAHAACNLNGTRLKGTKFYVKVTEKKVGGGSSTHTCKLFACDSLVAKLLASEKYRYQLDEISQTQQVRMKPIKSGNGFNLWGDPTNIATAENGIRLLANKVMAEIDQRSFSLSCIVVPLLQKQEMLKQAALIEEKHGVEFCLMDQSTHCPLGIAKFGSKVSEVFNSTSEIPGVSSFSKYMTSTSLTTPMSFASMTQTNAKSGNQRSIKRQTCTPTWHYQDDDKQFTPYNSQDSTEIEKMYKSHNTTMLTINRRVYTFDFDNMKQINVATKHTRPIQRQLAPNKHAVSEFTQATEPKLGLQVRGLKPNLQLAVKEFASELIANVVLRPHTLPPESDETLQLSLLQTTSQYLVAVNMTGNTFKVKGAKGYVDKVSLQIRQEMLAYKEKLLAKRSTPRALGRTVEVPSHWDTQTEKVVLKPVSLESKEWNDINSRVHETLLSAQVVRVERIQNQWLWEKYHFSKQRMSEKYRGIINEKDLFHGTSSTPPEKIFKSEQGFDFRFCSCGMWGTGTYFAVNASYSNNYAYTTGTRKQMILAKVLTGETCHCNPDSSLKKPPVKSRSKLGGSRNTFEDELYDSVKGHTNGSDIFVIYDHEKAYPAYLITYVFFST